MDILSDKLSDSIDWIKEKMGVINRSYMRILPGPSPNYNIQNEFELLHHPCEGIDIMRVLNNNGVSSQFGQAKIRGKMEYMLLLYVKYTDYQMSHGPFVAYIIKRGKFIDEKGRLYNSFVYFMKRYIRRPNGWNEVLELARDFYV